MSSKMLLPFLAALAAASVRHFLSRQTPASPTVAPAGDGAAERFTETPDETLLERLRRQGF